MTILIVDDEKDILEFLSYNLEKEGYLVKTANNGNQALSLASKIKPDLIILDVMMPEMDGMQTCEQIRGTKELENTLIVFLTARSEEYSELAGFASGADDYITKPIKPKLLISRIKALLKRAKLQPSSDIIEIGDLKINRVRHELSYCGNKVHLAKKGV